MKILFLTNHLNIGGITSYVLTLSTGLKKLGHDVYLASSGGGLLPKFEEAGIEYIHIPILTKQELSPKIILSRFKLSRALKGKNIDIVHSNSRTTQVLASILGQPHVATCHGFFKPRLSRIFFPTWGDRVIAISEQVKEHLVNDLKVDDKKVVVVNNGIDTEKFKANDGMDKAAAKRSFGLRDAPVVGIVARLSDVKGHIHLIEAMGLILKKYPAVQLLSFGDGKMKPELEKLAKELGLNRSVHFMTQAIDTGVALSAMDLFVMPSLKEGLGLALMEAMASGLAVIGSDVGGIKSLIRDGETGLLVRPADPQGLAAAIIELLNDPAKRKILGESARIFIAESFSQEKMCIATERVYRECLYKEN